MRRGGGGRRLAAAMAATAAATAAASPGPPAVALCANDPVSSLGAMLLEDERRSSLKVGALRVAGAGAAKPKDIMRETIARKKVLKRLHVFQEVQLQITHVKKVGPSGSP